MRCMNCGKGVMYGHNVSHAKNRTRKIFKPNLHAARVQMGQHKVKVRLCTKCLRVVRNAAKMVEVPMQAPMAPETPVVATA